MLHNCCFSITCGYMLEALGNQSYTVKAKRQGVKGFQQPILHSQAISPRRGSFTLTCQMPKVSPEDQSSSSLESYLEEMDILLQIFLTGESMALQPPFSSFPRDFSLPCKQLRASYEPSCTYRRHKDAESSHRHFSATMISTMIAVYRICLHTSQFTVRFFHAVVYPRTADMRGKHTTAHCHHRYHAD